MKVLLTYFLILAGALPLVIYPGIVLAAVMSLAAEEWKGEEFLLRAVVCFFLFGSLAYPVIYGPCAFLAFDRVRKEEDRAALFLSLLPIIYLLALGGLLTASVAMN